MLPINFNKKKMELDHKINDIWILRVVVEKVQDLHLIAEMIFSTKIELIKILVPNQDRLS